MIEAAASSGFALGGNGYRSADQQIAVRRNNCGLEPVRHLAEAGLAVPPAGGPPGHVDARARLAIDFTCNGALISSTGAPATAGCGPTPRASASTTGRARPGTGRRTATDAYGAAAPARWSSTRAEPAGGHGQPAGQVAAGHADLGRDDAGPHQQGEDPAAQAQGEDGLERRRHGDQGDEHAASHAAPAQPRDERADGERGPDALGEALGRSGHPAAARRPGGARRRG